AVRISSRRNGRTNKFGWLQTPQPIQVSEVQRVACSRATLSFFVTKRLAQPIFDRKILHSGEFLFVVGDNGIPECKRLSRYEQVIGADRSANLLKLRAQQSVSRIRGPLEGQNFKRAKYCF